LFFEEYFSIFRTPDPINGNHPLISPLFAYSQFFNNGIRAGREERHHQLLRALSEIRVLVKITYWKLKNTTIWFTHIRSSEFQKVCKTCGLVFENASI